MNAGDFWMKHQGKTCLIVSNGPNLELTPPEKFDYPSIGVNRIYKYAGWKPTYFVGVDDRLWKEYGQEIMAAYPDVPKFLPSPDRDDIEGENLVRFQHYHSSGHYIGGHMPTQYEALTRQGITYQRILGAAFQIAYYMGFTRMLVIGVQHKPGDENAHFFGDDPRGFAGQPLSHWFDEYRHWAHFGKAEVLNISEDTYVPEDVIPRGNWHDWVKE
jgi:hypothetical protein